MDMDPSRVVQTLNSPDLTDAVSETVFGQAKLEQGLGSQAERDPI
jgi:hypothetical protein